MRNGKMAEQFIESMYLQEKMSLKIYTPKDYSPFCSTIFVSCKMEMIIFKWDVLPH